VNPQIKDQVFEDFNLPIKYAQEHRVPLKLMSIFVFLGIFLILGEKLLGYELTPRGIVILIVVQLPFLHLEVLNMERVFPPGATWLLSGRSCEMLHILEHVDSVGRVDRLTKSYP
tara:strand:+ start:185 stop:529 length:345 start_codon:yes stop_codon:yes gene_type:complete